MKISIVSAFYNDKKMLKLFLDSVLNQTYSDLEHCIADGGSTDGSVELLKEYEEKYRQAGKVLKWVSEKDNGLYNGSNKAAGFATGDYMMFGSDPYVNNSVFDYLASFLQNKQPDYVYGGVYFQKDGVIIRKWNDKKGNWKLGWMMATPTLCIKSELWDKYGPADEKYHAAADYKLQLMLFRDKSLVSYPIGKKIVIFYAGGVSNGGLKGKLRSIKECGQILKECNVRCWWFVNLCKTIRGLCSYIFVSHKKVADLEDWK